ncbi:Methylxanthine N1-demethylase NdmA [Paraburkholderia domus]|uniref:aromatic ring-hydroxylating oxygenase subunit alpha n=1 Tax=Paraburkholderia domus TaxID=2793075 RepID=UPI001913AC1A|nr:aromatic ring-hydroxylating dioxygenase subunit alpha [Paraburkholderia domus]MBK5050487.1 aromatic ring-hydroxylating dioxygenase subunit alpha [Burkholderia sp. R-70006]CAE6754019.1 Methylxanthine N1-demethylase NdmA [Paraburkholderia domus]
MSFPTIPIQTKRPLPKNCSFSASDWNVLSSFWHPVALSSEVKDKPVGVQLLDALVVLYRTPEGVNAARDVCMHRGAKLSLGSIRDGALVCGFHGFHYNCEGVCVRIPALPTGSPIPNKLRLQTYLCAERYGFVWVCLAEKPRASLPDWPSIENGSGTVAVVPPGTWQSSAARHVENFNDICHVPWVHTGTFGGPETPIEPYDVSVTDTRLSFQADITERVRYTESGAGPTYRQAVYSYELTLPFASSVKVLDPNTSHVYRIYDIASPVSASCIRIFQVVVDESRLTPAEALIDFTMRINAEDAPQVESQSPDQLPLDLRDEIHIPADRMSIEYRRALARLGLGAQAVS